jgi:hypothetical protein
VTGWQHVWQSRGYAASVCIDHAEDEPPCGCTTPTPDPEYTPLVRDHEGRLQPGYGPDYRCACSHPIAMEADR